MMGLTGAFSSLNISDPSVDDSEHPVDFSKKYLETKKDHKSGPRFNNVVGNLTIYAETDLDQPTDYSLRYAEDDSDSDRCIKPPKTTEFVQDTVKTYCTEDTPYETPFNFSTSTSMSDLRIDDKDKSDKNVTVINAKTARTGKIKSEFSSGLMSPEKPVKYCEEGTPGYFSRVPSCGDLNEPPKSEIKEETSPNMDEKRELRKNKLPAETKAVKFEEVVNYAEETPLMFSRSSSLASLDSIEQHSIHDDRSSVVSDFSRLTSGVVSPSELPDSPSQTVPPSPRLQKTLVFPSPPKQEDEEIPKTVPKCSVFEDVVKKFKVESTPLHFSTATSLSSLIDDEIEEKGQLQNEEQAEVKDEIEEHLNGLDLSESSEDEDILAACINFGMQSNRYSQPKTKSPSPITPQSSYKYSDSAKSRINDDLMQKTDVTSDSLRTYCTEGTPALLSHAGSHSDLSILSMPLNEKKDALEAEKRALCDLKMSDIHEESAIAQEPKGDSRRSSFSCLSEETHESDDALLEECILAGMPKSKVSSGTNTEEKKLENGPLTDDETDILENCIKIGIESNRYTQPKLNSNYQKPSSSNNDDTVKSYCTEDTPAGLSHAGSISNLSVLSMQGNEATNFSDGDFSDDDDDDKLLEECVKYGMAAFCGKVKTEGNSNRMNVKKMDGAKEEVPSDDNISLSSFSDDSYETDQILLQQCIKAGMPKRQNPPQSDSGELTQTEKSLLQQCILEGMKKCRTAPTKPPEEDSGELTEAEQALLRQCIIAGMPKNRNLAQGGPSRSRESTELTESERLLLQQCILAGMPKNKAKSREKQVKKAKEEKSEHTCCVHCPRNKNKHKGKKKYKERGSRDVYVSSQILSVKKEVVDRTRDNWV